MKPRIDWNELGTDVSVREARRLLKDPATRELPDLSVDIVRAFEVPGGRVLLVIPNALPDKGPMFAWHSREHLERYNRAQEKVTEHGGRHVLLGHTCGRHDFPQKTPALCAELSELLSLHPDVPNFTSDSFIHIDRALKAIDWEAPLEDPLLSCLYAYVGETLRRLHGGEFILVQDTTEPEVWIPYVNVDGKRVDFVLPLYDELAEPEGRERNLHRVVLSLIGR